jgi:hypothetical protein
VRLHLKPALGRKRLASLTVAELDKLWTVKRKTGYSANSIRVMRTVLRRALGQAEREGIVARNVAALSAPPRIRAKERRALTVNQARSRVTASRRPSRSLLPTACAVPRCLACTSHRSTGTPGRWRLHMASSESRTETAGLIGRRSSW